MIETNFRDTRITACTSALIILTAVGAVNMLTTLCCSMTRKNAPASGVPTGLPYQKMEEQLSLALYLLNIGTTSLVGS